MLLLLVGVVVALSFPEASSEDCDLWTFPDSFVFGAGSSAYQIEGGWNEDGKSRSFFDWYLNDNRSSFITENGNVAADSYHKYSEDIEAIRKIGLERYRFSISWTRILPKGLSSEINQAGVDYYNKIIDSLLEIGVEPFVTIFHMDTPLTLHFLGEWTSPSMVDYFVQYADVAFRLFGDRVKLWGTINEPALFCSLLPASYQSSGDLPELPVGTYEYKCVHQMLLAHAKAYRLYEKKYKPTQKGKVGIVVDFGAGMALNDTVEDLEATHRYNIFHVNWILDPLTYGDYPDLIKQIVARNSANQNFSSSRLPNFSLAEKRLLKGANDVVFLNYYSTYTITTSTYNNTPSYENDLQVTTGHRSEWNVTNIGFPIYNPGMRRTLNYLKDNFNNPDIIIAENGYSNLGGLDDPDRIAFIQETLYYVRIAMCVDKVSVLGYTIWSLLDSFEWNSGYSGKFGLVLVDYNSTELTRTLKTSAYYYSNLIKTNSINATYF